MTLEFLVTNYGYPAILLGTFFEGETILVIGGFLAHRGYLTLPGVMLAAFLGTFAGDQLYFFLGRRRGMAALRARPDWERKSAKVFDLLRRHKIALIIGFRFLYGIRIVTPFAIGASGVAPLTFFLLNLAGALFWSVTIGTLGYLFGQSISLVIDHVKQYEGAILLGLLVVGLIAWTLSFLKRRSGARR